MNTGTLSEIAIRNLKYEKDVYNIMNEKLIVLFEKANKVFLMNDLELLISKVSERTLCGALMLHINNVIQNSEFAGYKVDVEYNRNKNGKIKTHIKTINGPKDIVVSINCDLIVHTRGKNIKQDNLIAIEMKKSERKQDEKDSDRSRLIALTKDSFNDTWSFDEKTLPEHVCRYALGIYYEVNYKKQIISIEYYKKGYKLSEYEINF